MFRSKFIVKKVGELQKKQPEENANGADSTHQWRYREIIIEENNLEAYRPESAVVKLWDADADYALSPGMEIEVSLFLRARVGSNGKDYNEVDYRALKVMS